MIRRPSRLLLCSLPLILAVAPACGGGVTTVVPTRPTALVVVKGDGTHLIGSEIARDGAHVKVALHDGRRVWVPSQRVRPLELTEGAHVVTRWNGASLYPARVVARHGELVQLQYADGSEAIVAMTSIVASSDARLDVPERGPDTWSDGGAGGDTPDDAPDPSRLAIARTTEVWVRGRAIRCDDGGSRAVRRRHDPDRARGGPPPALGGGGGARRRAVSRREVQLPRAGR